MNDLIILGASVHAAEMAEIVTRINQQHPTWRLLGFVVTSGQAGRTGSKHAGLPILGTTQVLSQYPGCRVAFEWDFHDPLDVPIKRWASLIDPSCFVSATAHIGGGCVLYPNCFVGLNATLGNRVFSLSGAIINHDDVLEDGATLCSGATLAGEIHVEARCYLGQSCTIRQKLRIGAGSLIGMGSVVIRDVPPNSVMAGNPARRLRDNK